MESDGSSAIWGVIGFVYAIIAIVGLWKVFIKAGKPGWAATYTGPAASTPAVPAPAASTPPTPAQTS